LANKTLPSGEKHAPANSFPVASHGLRVNGFLVEDYRNVQDEFLEGIK